MLEGCIRWMPWKCITCFSPENRLELHEGVLVRCSKGPVQHHIVMSMHSGPWLWIRSVRTHFS
jgi:hypothetical protein